MPTLALALAVAFAPFQSPAAQDAPFPPSTALAERLSPEGLQALSKLVQSFVDANEIVSILFPKKKKKNNNEFISRATFPINTHRYFIYIVLSFLACSSKPIQNRHK